MLVDDTICVHLIGVLFERVMARMTLASLGAGGRCRTGRRRGLRCWPRGTGANDCADPRGAER
jgi:hypothetical protein